MTIDNYEWLSLMKICKPKKNAKIGIPYKPWHHIAFIDGYAILYVWNTREIQDAFKIEDIDFAALETTVVNDNFRELHVGDSTTKRAKTAVTEIMKNNPFLPIFESLDMTMKDVKAITEDLLSVVTEISEEHNVIIGTNARTVTFPEFTFIAGDTRMFKIETNRMTCMDLYIGRKQQYFMQAKLLTIFDVVCKTFGKNYDIEALVGMHAIKQMKTKLDKKKQK